MGISGIELCRRFYAEVVGPLVDGPHSAALIGRGSEVLGYDDEMSADHNCEARVVLFVEDPAFVAPEVPGEFLGRKTAAFGSAGRWLARPRAGADGGVRVRRWAA
jgi:hypothetical protein